jgi:Flp pilus assembly protein TadD/predicted Zn-dependent protease with MMP-like domain
MRTSMLIALGLAACSGGGKASAPAQDDAGVASVAPAAAAAEPAPSGPGGDIDAPAPLPVADCPVEPGDREAPERTLDRLLEQAAASFDDGRLGEAWTCADQAADLAPSSVEAHHLRASALAALGHDAEAELAYTMTLALDPDDPETLRAVADFYLNVRGARGRDTAAVALELARRGLGRATARRRGNAVLRADLALLEAQALNDLGRSDEALDGATEALRLQPGLVDAVHEKGVALFNLGRFAQAQAAFSQVLGELPDDAYAHHFLGLALEALGQRPDAEAHFRRARELSPDEFPAPILISEDEFRAEIAQVLTEVSAETHAKLAAVPIVVVDFPAREDLEAVDPPFPPTILGLFRGLPHGVEMPVAPGQTPPTRAIVLYRINLARAVRSREELSEQIRRTLLHEIGHLEGLDEDDLRRRGLE